MNLFEFDVRSVDQETNDLHVSNRKGDFKGSLILLGTSVREKWERFKWQRWKREHKRSVKGKRDLIVEDVEVSNHTTKDHREKEQKGKETYGFVREWGRLERKQSVSEDEDRRRKLRRNKRSDHRFLWWVWILVQGKEKKMKSDLDVDIDTRFCEEDLDVLVVSLLANSPNHVLFCWWWWVFVLIRERWKEREAKSTTYPLVDVDLRTREELVKYIEVALFVRLQEALLWSKKSVRKSRKTGGQVEETHSFVDINVGKFQDQIDDLFITSLASQFQDVLFSWFFQLRDEITNERQLIKRTTLLALKSGRERSIGTISECPFS